MPAFIIEGGHSLKGEITPQGAKNEALQVLCATLLTDEPVRISNLPDISDINHQIRLLQDIGVSVTRHGQGDMTFRADNVNLDYLQSEEFLERCSRLRGSVMLVGPLITRFGHAMISKPGGDKIGRRRLEANWAPGSSIWRIAKYLTSGRNVCMVHTCCWTRLPSRAQPTSSWRHPWPMGSRQSTTQHANRTYSNYAECFAAWAQR